MTSFAFSQQKMYYKSTFSGNVGLSFVGLGVNLISKQTINTIGSVELIARPMWQGSYHYFFKKWFSLGIAYSSQQIIGTVYDYEYYNNNVLEYIDFNVVVKRSKIGVYPMFHYGKSAHKDMYSGFNIGVLHNKATLNTEFAGVITKDLFSFNMGARPSMQLLLYGIRYYINKNVGFNFEVGLGAPFFCNTGFQIRL